MDINQVAIDAALYLTPILAALLGEYLRRKIGTERIKKIQAELAAKTELTAAAVNLAEQAYKDLDGAGKYDKALEWLSTQALKVGLKITVDEAKGLIESAVLALKRAVI
jgi:hypothetical protein